MSQTVLALTLNKYQQEAHQEMR